MRLNEIERLNKSDYEGGKGSLYAGHNQKRFKQLPGGSGFLYTIEGDGDGDYSIKLWDPEGNTDPDERPQKDPYEFQAEYQARLKQWEQRQRTGKKIPQIIGKLTLGAARFFPMKGALQVGTITVDEDYRGVGLAKALYGIVLTIMKRPLVAGDSQTPGGRRNWVSLASIPGVEMKGYISIDEEDLNPSAHDYAPYKKQVEQNIDTIMGKLGGQYIGKGRYETEYFAFDVKPSSTGKELEAYVKQNMAKVYDASYSFGTGLYAVWAGQ